jgi:RimJ/RimL family protein N-acetyltransferase
MSDLIIRSANSSDIFEYFKWLNDPDVRLQSFNSDLVSWNDHVRWFNQNISNPNYSFYIFEDLNNKKIGQVRIQKIDNHSSIIGVSLGSEYRGKGLGVILLKKACKEYFKTNPLQVISAFIKQDNIASKLIFERAGFQFFENILYKNTKSFHYKLYADRKI